jgi:hypothetical protein
VSTGDYLLRLGPEKLAEARKAAEGEGAALSQWLRDAVDAKLAGGSTPRPASRDAILRELAEIAAKVADGHVLVPRGEGIPPSWDNFMDGEAPR